MKSPSELRAWVNREKASKKDDVYRRETPWLEVVIVIAMFAAFLLRMYGVI